MKTVIPVVLFLLFTACATPFAQNIDHADPFEARDPMKPLNQAVFDFDLAVDCYAVKPIAENYHYVPSWFRNAVNNFLSNLGEPANAVNGALQLNPDIAFSAFWRFGLNSTFGLVGLRDFAGENGLKNKDTDFSKTLGRYGVNEGVYVMLPFVGPSTVRDTAGKAVDWVIDPVGLVFTLPESVAQGAADAITTRDSNAAMINQFYYGSLEPYSATRAAYLQHQAFK